jgi:hypothetical protein
VGRRRERIPFLLSVADFEDEFGEFDNFSGQQPETPGFYSEASVGPSFPVDPSALGYPLASSALDPNFSGAPGSEFLQPVMDFGVIVPQALEPQRENLQNSAAGKCERSVKSKFMLIPIFF